MPSAPTRRSSSLDTGSSHETVQIPALVLRRRNSNSNQYTASHKHTQPDQQPATMGTQRTSWLAHSRYSHSTQSPSQGHLDEVIRIAIANCWGAILVNLIPCKFRTHAFPHPPARAGGGCVTEPAEPSRLALAER